MQRDEQEKNVNRAFARKRAVVALAAVIALTGILTVLTPPARTGSAASTPSGQAAALRYYGHADHRAGLVRYPHLP